MIKRFTIEIEIHETKFSQFKKLSKNEEDIVLTGCGGDPHP